MYFPWAISIALMVAAPMAAAADPNQMDIAGVTLGMPIETAGATLKAAGYKCTPFGSTLNFNEQVQKEVETRRGTYNSFGAQQSARRELSCAGQNGETIKVQLAHPRRGSIVDEIQIYLPVARFAKADIVQQLSSKYGKPTTGTAVDGAWCNAGYRCADAPLFVEGPQFRTMGQGDNITIMATRGKRAREADKAEVLAEADRLAPKAGKATF